MYNKEEIDEAKKEYLILRKKSENDLKNKLSTIYPKENAEDIAKAMSEFLDYVTEGDALGWLAGLYDAEIGGFYFSNSARDCKEFLPDLESTVQSIGLFISSKAASYIAPTVKEALPEGMGEDVVRFAKKLQDPHNGYFYHPQWDKEETNRSLGRLGRDLNWAVRLFGYFGACPTYDTPTGISGDGVDFDGKAVDPRISEIDKSNRTLNARPELENRESFGKLLKSLEPKLSTHSWEIGNRFESEGTEIAARDKKLEALGLEGGFCDMLAEWFAKNQNPVTGMWTSVNEANYDGTNGLLKICSTYNKIGRAFPRPAEALASAIKCIVKEDEPETVCHVLNPWYAVNVITMNVNRFYNGQSEAEEIRKFRSYISENCAEMIRATAKKLSYFKIGDGSFIYKRRRAGRSQGMRVAPDNVWEGDVNATTICARAIAEHIYEILDFEMPPLYSKGDAMNFINVLNMKKQKAKK